jgi:hypothetical protein
MLKMLVAYDGTEGAKKALERAAGLAGTCRGRSG